MLPRLKELKKLEAHAEHKKVSARLKRSSIHIDGCECKQAIPLSDGAYCGIWKAIVNEGLCSSCPYFDLEPLEYKLFRRT